MMQIQEQLLCKQRDQDMPCYASQTFVKMKYELERHECDRLRQCGPNKIVYLR